MYYICCWDQSVLQNHLIYKYLFKVFNDTQSTFHQNVPICYPRYAWQFYKDTLQNTYDKMTCTIKHDKRWTKQRWGDDVKFIGHKDRCVTKNLPWFCSSSNILEWIHFFCFITWQTAFWQIKNKILHNVYKWYKVH